MHGIYLASLDHADVFSLPMQRTGMFASINNIPITLGICINVMLRGH
jgi:hypothetical protein